MFSRSRDIPPKPPEGKRACSRIASPSHNEGTISNAEVASDSVSPHLLGLILIFVSTKQKLKKKSFVQRLKF